MLTKPAPVYPACFAGMKLDQVNEALRQGIATESDAVQMVKWWNESGKRVTVASLYHRAVILSGVELLAPCIRITP